MQNKIYWLRGGIIGIVVDFIVTFGVMLVALGVHNIKDAYGPFVGAISDFFEYVLLYSFLGEQGFSSGEIFIISLFYCFFVGGLIGWIYGLVRNRT